MKLIFLLAVAGLSSAAKLDNAYLPPSNAPSSGGNNFLRTPVTSNYQRNAPSQGQHNQGVYAPSSSANGYNNNYDGGFNQGQVQERAQAAFERNAAIFRLDNENDGETYSYAYETENGISADEHGVATNGVEAKGGFSYTGDDGQVYSIRYTADQNGFVPYGDHLPTPPPIPQEILEALQKNAQDEAAGIFDDGTYSSAKYNNGDDNGNNGYSYNTGNNKNQFNNNNQGNDGNDYDSVVTDNASIRNNNQKNFRNQGSNYQGGFGNHAANNQGFGNQRNFNQGSNGVTQAYLPPFERNNQFGNRQFSGNQQLHSARAGNFGKQAPSFNNQQGSQYRNQAPRTQAGANNQAYLPPFESQRSQKSANQGQRHQGVNNAYLPPQ